jgi:hypothetical protein
LELSQRVAADPGPKEVVLGGNRKALGPAGLVVPGLRVRLRCPTCIGGQVIAKLRRRRCHCSLGIPPEAEHGLPQWRWRLEGDWVQRPKPRCAGRLGPRRPVRSCLRHLLDLG